MEVLRKCVTSKDLPRYRLVTGLIWLCCYRLWSCTHLTGYSAVYSAALHNQTLIRSS